MSEKAKELGPGEWITGGGWDEYHFTEQRKPLRGDLDAAAPNNPVVLTEPAGTARSATAKRWRWRTSIRPRRILRAG